MFTMLLALRIVVVVVAIAIALGGVALLVVGLVQLGQHRRTVKGHEPSYSDTVRAPDAGEGIADDFEDTPQFIDQDLLLNGEPASHAAPDPYAEWAQMRRNAIMFVGAGSLVAAIGITLATAAWELVL